MEEQTKRTSVRIVDFLSGCMELLRAENSDGGAKAKTDAAAEQVFCNTAITAAVMMAQPSSLLQFILLIMMWLCFVEEEERGGRRSNEVKLSETVR